MVQNAGRSDLLPPTVPTLALLALAAFGIIVWVTLHFVLFRKRQDYGPKTRFAVCAFAGMVACWALFQWASRQVYLAGSWSLWLAAFTAAFTTEASLLLYERECSVVNKWLARLMMLCRMGAILTLVFILLQPVLFAERSRPIRRRVAVLMDQSGSMLRTDRQWLTTEKLDLAEAFGLVPHNDRRVAGAASAMADAPGKVAHWRDISLASDKQVLDVEEIRGFSKATEKNVNDVLVAMRKILMETEQRANDFKAQRDKAEGVRKHAEDSILPAVRALARIDENTSVRDALASLAETIGPFVEGLPECSAVSDDVLWALLPEENREKIEELCDEPRAELARRLITNAGGSFSDSPLAKLAGKYDVDVFRFGQEVVPVYDVHSLATNVIAKVEADDQVDTNSVETAFRSSTDLTRAIENVMTSIPFDELAGIMVVSDGRNTSGVSTESVSRRLGQAKVPISSVVIGGTRLPFDAAIATVRAPESVFLGDRVRLIPVINVTGGKGKDIAVRAFLGEAELKSETFKVDSDEWTKEIRFDDMPEERGLRRYKIVIDPLEGEEIADNNTWEIDVSVSDDRTNVLLADSLPRWEYRYLKNLFYGRDKSVHLQYYLIHPDEVFGAPDPDLPAASVSRKFGDAESGSFPINKDEWRKFDVIIIGDLDNADLTDDVVGNIRYCVEERGALLVVIAGPEHMPFQIRNPRFLEMLPVTVEKSSENRRTSPERGFRLQVTPSGRSHMIMQQSSSAFENEQAWNDLPDFRWRLPVESVKPGAEVLAYAETPETRGSAGAQKFAAEITENPEEATERLKQVRERQEKNSLIVTRNFGRGKVMMLNTDRTWRLRYRVGDLRHHQFWGQVVRWGAGEKLRAGNTFVRLGSNKLRYTPTDEIRVLARLTDRSFVPIDEADAEVRLYSGDKLMGSVKMRSRPDSNGMYDGTFPPIKEPGIYDLELVSPTARKRLGEDFPQQVRTRFVVVTALRPEEFVNVTADWVNPRSMASYSGGSAVPPSRINTLLDSFGEGSRVLKDRVEIPLWNSWMLFAAILALLTVEWLLRKKGGLA